ncbi:glycosyltransferase family 4 protein [Maricaulis sp.]|uniref:glycosyltransferase family 4 protein n=1 Tax=Maricaulis sp. TaxID=1486257 RepID=UPI002616DF0D|nr:glycosyltransferase family 4 protein [Maricaulis sp.]
MIVLQVIPELDAGGAERTTLEVAEALVAAGGRALVASQGGRLEGELEAMGGELVRLPVATKNPWVAWRNVARLSAVIRDQGVDIVHARSRAPALSAKAACDKTGAHFVTTYHGTYNANSGLKRWYNSFMAKGERVIANSEFIRDHICHEHPFAAERVTVIPRGVDLERFDAAAISPDRVEALAADWGIEADARVVLLPGRLTGWKGQRETIRAYAQLKAGGAELPVLILAGDAQGRTGYVDELAALIEEGGLSGQVRMVGHCSDMPAAFALSRLVLTPSVEPEAFGRTAAEAGAMGLPVIAADHGGAREVIVEGETGWRVKPGDVAALADAIAQALNLDATALDNLAERAKARIQERFSARQLQASTLRVYNEVLQSKS